MISSALLPLPEANTAMFFNLYMIRLDDQMAGLPLLIFKCDKKGAAFAQFALYPHLAAHGLDLGFSDVQAKSFCVGMEMENLSDLKKIIFMFFHVYAKSVVFYRE